MTTNKQNRKRVEKKQEDIKEQARSEYALELLSRVEDVTDEDVMNLFMSLPNEDKKEIIEKLKTLKEENPNSFDKKKELIRLMRPEERIIIPF